MSNSWACSVYTNDTYCYAYTFFMHGEGMMNMSSSILGCVWKQFEKIDYIWCEKKSILMDGKVIKDYFSLMWIFHLQLILNVNRNEIRHALSVLKIDLKIKWMNDFYICFLMLIFSVWLFAKFLWIIYAI